MKRTILDVTRAAVITVIATAFAGCSIFGGGSLSISGTVTGLKGTATLVLNDGQQFSLEGDGPFSFDADFDQNIEYEISVIEWPGVQGWHIEGGTISADGTEISGIDLQFFYLYFFAADDGSETALWKSDGTPDGTVKVRGFTNWIYIQHEGSWSNPAFLGDEIFFEADDGDGGEIWKSDGTATGTSSLGIQDADELVAFDNALYYSAWDLQLGTLLWRTDGTVGSEELVVPVSEQAVVSSLSNLTPAGNVLYFSGRDGQNDTEVWKFDPQTESLTRVKDINPTGSSFPSGIAAFGNSVVFSANTAATGAEPYISDGTDAGTVQLDDIQSGFEDSYPGDFAQVGDYVFFSAWSDNDQELYKTDGTQVGTGIVANINASGDSSPGGITEFNGIAYFRASDGTNGSELWQSDGTQQGTVMAVDVNGDPAESFPIDIVAVGPRLVFYADHPDFGMEPWAFIPDAKATGSSQLLRDIYSGTNGSYIGE